MSETFSFTTYRPQVVQVFPPPPRITFYFERTRHNRQALAKGTITRTSNLSASGEPMACGSGTPSSCGAKPFSVLALQANAVFAGSTNRFLGVGVSNAAALPRDPFSQCGGAATAFPSVLDRPTDTSSRYFYAPISARFLKGCSRATQTRTGKGSARLDAVDATGTTTIQFKVSVTRVRCIG
jgi:hypothetical protein